MQTSPVDQALNIFRKSGGVLRTKDALERGIHPRTLYQLRDDGILSQVSRGIYRLASLPDLSHPDLVTVALRAPRSVVCLVSALAYHESTSQVPHEVQIALPRGTKTPKIDHPPIRVFRFSGPALTDGIEHVTLDHINVPIYSLAKTIVDCFRLRNKLGTDVAVEALSDALRTKRVRPAELLKLARRCRVERVILPYIEALQ